MRIAVLAVQGAFIEHENMLASLGCGCLELRRASDLEQPFDGLVLPGGESTVMGKLLRELDMFVPLLTQIRGGLPVFGTCAGLLLLAETIANDGKTCFATVPGVARRNAYGRQLGSFQAEEEFAGLGKVPMPFIRAPYLESVGRDTEVLATVGGKIVAARYGRQLVTAFHPELTGSTIVHEAFLRMVEAAS